MKKLISLLLIISMLATLALTFSSCGERDNTQDNGQENNNQVQEDLPLSAALKIAGNDISTYKIVYAESTYNKKIAQGFNTEHDFYRLIAYEIRNRIYAITGVILDAVQDTKTDESANEILVGPTNRAESDTYDKMDVYKYSNSVSSGKLVLGGGYDSTSLSGNIKKSSCYASTYHAFDYIEEYLQQQVNAGKTEIDLEEGFSQSGKVEGIITVACIGDSITDGAGASDANVTAYPAVLQRFLWKDYIVVNYGCSGKTMRNDLADTYTKCGQYTYAVKNANKFDIALIMLGTNDSNRDTTQSDAVKQKYNDSAFDLVEKLTKNNKDLHITIMSCPAYYANANFGSLFIRKLQLELVSLLKDEGYDAGYYDMHKFTSEVLTNACFPDNLHPNDKGYSLMGEELAKVVPKELGLPVPELPDEG